MSHTGAFTARARRVAGALLPILTTILVASLAGQAQAQSIEIPESNPNFPALWETRDDALLARQAQAPTEVWSATLTPRATFSGDPVPLGCDNTSTGNRRCSNSNTLSDDFTDDGTTYAVTKFFTRNGVLTFRLDTGATAATQGLTLVIDGEEFVLKEADQINGGKTQWKWNNTTLGWTAGTDVAVSLVATDAPATGQPTISGGGQVGKTLTAATDDIEDPDGLPTTPTFTYQWVRVDGSTDTDIPGATSETYTLTTSDLGKQIKVKVSFTDLRGHAEGPLTSDAYPRNGTVTVVVLPGPCPAVNDWCAVVTVADAEGDGRLLGYEYDKFGSLDDDQIEYGGENFNVWTVHSYKELSRAYFYLGSIPRVPRGTVVTVGERTFTTDAESDDGSTGDLWHYPVGQLPPDLVWSDGQEVRVSLVLGSFPAEGAPAITGAAQVGKTLTAGLGTIADTDGLPATFPNDYMFQWVRVDADGVSNETPIGANAATYTPVAADAGKKIKVKVSFTDDRGTAEGPLTSDAYPSSGTIMLPAGVTVSKSALTVTEQDATGDTYTVVLNSRPTASVTVTVGGYTGSDVTPNPASLTFAPSVWNTVLTVTVTAEGDTNTVDETVSLTHSATSTDTDYSGITIASVTVTVDDNANPAAEGKPTISGPAQVGRTLTAATADITDADGLTMVSYEYQWIASGTVIADATSSTYTPTSSEQGDKITVRVTFDDDEDNPETLTSDETAPVVPDAASCGGSAVWCSTLTVGYSTPDLYGAFVGLATNIRTPPESFGSLVGATFTHLGTSYTVTQIFAVERQLFLATSPNLSDDGAGLTLHIQRVSGTYALKLSDRGFYGIFPQFPAGTKVWYFSGVLAPGPANPPLLRAYSGVNGDYEQETDEGTLLTVSLFHENRDAEGTPTISGTAQVGQVLTADPSGIIDADGLTTATFTYQWLRVDADGVSNETPIGANAATYTLAAADAGKKIKVKVSFTDDGGTAEGPLTSDAYPSRGTTNTSTLSTDATLSDLELWDNTGTAITLTPTFVSATTSYTAMVANSVDEITIFPKENDDNAPYEIQDSGGTALTDADSVEDEFQVTLSVGDNTIKVEVTAEDGSTQTYTVTVTRAAGTPTAGVTVSKSALTVTEQDATGDTYTVVLDSEPTASVTVTVGGYTGSDVTPNPASLTFAPSVWNVVLTVTVTAEGDTNTVDETVSLTHSATSTDTDYSGITIASVTVTVDDNDNPNTPPEGTPTISGTAQVGEVLTADPSGITDADGLTTATFTYQWLRVDADGVSNETNIGTNAATYTPVAADVGKKIKVRVNFTDDGGTAEGPLTSDAYPPSGSIGDSTTLSTDATLSDLELADNTDTAITLTPTFVSATTSYTAMVANSVDEITIFPKENDDNASYEIQDSGGTALTDADSVEYDFQVTLSVGDNTIKVEVTAEDSSTQTYTVTVTRAAETPTAGVTVSKSALTVTEEDTTGDSYTVVLDSQPTASVTVTVGGYTGSDVTPNPASLTWAPSVWNIPLTVTVTAEGDMNTVDETVSLTHSATSTDTDYSGITIASVTVTVDDNDNPNTPPEGTPTISGTAQVGEVLTADPSGITDADGLTTATFTYQWLRVDADGVSNETNIGANAATYTLAAADAGKKIKVKVSFTDDGGTAEGPLTSDAYPSQGTTTALSTDATLSDLELWDNTGTAITLTPTFVSATTSYTAMVANSVDEITIFPKENDDNAPYEIQDSGGTALTDADSVEDDFQVTLSVGDNTIKVEVTAEDGSTQTYTVTVTRAAGTPTAGVTVSKSALTVTEQDATGDSYTVVLNSRPTASVTVTVGGYTGSDVTPNPASLTWAPSVWNIPLTVTVTAEGDTDTADDMVSLTHSATSTDTDYSGITIASVTVTVDDNDNPNTPPEGTPTISGTAQVGEVLTADPSGITDADGLATATFTYQWLRVDADGVSNETNIGTNAATYTLAAADAGKKIKVKVSFTDDGGTAEGPLTSDAYPSSGTITAATLPVLSISGITEDEDDGPATLTVELAPASTGTVTVDFATRDQVGGAKEGEDYTATSGTLTFTAGQTSKTITVPITDDDIYENYEAFFVDLSNPTGATLPVFPTAAVGIDSEDAVPTASMADVTVDEGAGTMTLILRLSHPSHEDIAYSTVDTRVTGTATEGEDYDDFLLGPPAGTARITVPGGSLSHTFDITVVDDGVDEADETIVILWQKVTGDEVNPTTFTFTGTIVPVPLPALSFASNEVTVDEDAGSATLTIELTPASTGTVTVDYATRGSSATAGEDYTTTSGTLTFAASETSKTITVPILNDNVYELFRESFFIDITNPTGATLPDPPLAAVRIDSEEAVPTASMADVTVDEGAGTMTLTLRLNHPSQRDIAYNTIYDEDVETGTATEGEDYDDFLQGPGPGRTAKITVPARSLSQTFDITLVDDGEDEPDETIVIQWIRNSNDDATPNFITFTGTITDNDTAVNNPATGAPTISGTAQVGETLTAAIGNIADTDGLPTTFPDDYTYQWLRVDADGVSNETNIGTNAATYTLAAADAGKKIKVKVSFTDDGGTAEGPLTSDAYPSSGSIGDSTTRSLVETYAELTVQRPGNIGDPVRPSGVVGTVHYSLEGEDAGKFMISSSNGQLSTRVGERYDYEEKPSYAVTVNAANQQGISVSILVIINIVDLAERPTQLGAPTVSATAGSITSLDVSWTAPPSLGIPAITHYNLRYREDSVETWTDGPQNVTGTAAQITGLTADTPYQVGVQAVNHEGSVWSGYGAGRTDAPTVSFGASAYTAIEGVQDVTVTVELFPAASRAVTILLTATPEGGATAADWSGVPERITFAADETSKTFTMTARSDSFDETGESVQLGFGTLPSGIKLGSPATATVALVDDAAGNNPATGTPAISGTAQVGETLTAAIGNIADTDGLPTTFPDDYTLKWLRVDADGVSNETAIGDDAATYTPVAADVGKKVRVQVSFTDDESTREERTSDAYPSSGTIVPVPLPTLSFAPNEVTVDEDAGSATLTVELDPASTGTVTVDYATRDSSAKAGEDYTATSGTLTFAATETSKTFTVPITDDDVYENNESFQVDLSNPTGATVPVHPTATVTIDSEDAAPTVRFGASSYTAIEGVAGAVVTVLLDTAAAHAVTIPVTTTPQDGASSTDYSDVPGSVTFAAGETEQSFTVTATEDSADDDGESVKLGFDTLPSGVLLGSPATATVALVDNADVSTWFLFFEESSYTATEGGTAAQVTVGLNNPWKPELNESLTIGIFTPEHRGGADASDYSGVPAQVTFRPGQTRVSFTVTATNDSDDDDGESIYLQFAGFDIEDLELDRGPRAATVHLRDNDGASAVQAFFGAQTYSVNEGSTVDVSVHLDKAPGRELTILITTAHGNGASSADYNVPESITFSDSQSTQTFAVQAQNDNVNDDQEYLTFGFGALPASVSAGDPATTTLNLVDTNDSISIRTISFDAQDTNVRELLEGSIYSLYVYLNSAADNDIVVPLQVTHLDGASSADYSGLPETVIIPAGERRENVIIRVLEDAEDDHGEGIRVRFGPLPRGVRKDNRADTATFRFLDNDTLPAISIAGADVKEWPNPQSYLKFVAALDYAPEFEVAVDYRTVDGSAVAGQDYESTSGTLTFAEGERSKYIRVLVCHDGIDESTETMTLQLSNPVRTKLEGNGSATGSIRNNNGSGAKPCATGISVSDVSAPEPNSKHLQRQEIKFEVSLNQADTGTVTVDYQTVDGTATAGQDYESASGTVTFRPGQTRRTVKVVVVADAHDDPGETFTLRLSNPSGAYIGDREGTATLTNSGLMPGAWLSRFGRVASDHAVQAIEARIYDTSGHARENHLTIGGQRVDWQMLGRFAPSGPGQRGDRASPDGVAPRLDPWLGDQAARTRMDRLGAEAMAVRSPAVGSLSVGGMAELDSGGNPAIDSLSGEGMAGVDSGRARGSGGGDAKGTFRRAVMDLLGLEDLSRLSEAGVGLMGISFFYSRPGGDEAPGWLGPWSLWGETAVTRFDGAEGPLSLNGDVTTATVGFDTRRERWMAGLALAYSEGQGAYTHRIATGGAMDSSLTSLIPYASYSLNERTSVWGTLGYGVGDLTLTPEGAASGIETDLSTAMAAFGGRGVFSVRTAGAAQFEFAVRADARLTSTVSDAVENLAGAAGATSRVRAVLEGRGSVPLAWGGDLSPRLEVGLRYDGGDAETGAGLEIGGGLGYAAGRLSVEVTARGLVAHQDTEYEEWGFGGSIAYTPSEDGRGLSMRLGSAWGATQSGVQSLWNQQDASGLARSTAFEAAQRFEAELGYGIAGRRRNSLWVPFIAAQAADGGGQALQMGVRLASESSLEAELRLGRRQDLQGVPEHAVELRASMRW